ncbi:MAG: hypothetical protein ACE5HE_12420 [Phycisphaerae bacterium]
MLVMPVHGGRSKKVGEVKPAFRVRNGRCTSFNAIALGGKEGSRYAVLRNTPGESSLLPQFHCGDSI